MIENCDPDKPQLSKVGNEFYAIWSPGPGNFHGHRKSLLFLPSAHLTKYLTFPSNSQQQPTCKCQSLPKEHLLAAMYCLLGTSGPTRVPSFILLFIIVVANRARTPPQLQPLLRRPYQLLSTAPLRSTNLHFALILSLSAIITCYFTLHKEFLTRTPSSYASNLFSLPHQTTKGAYGAAYLASKRRK